MTIPDWALELATKVAVPVATTAILGIAAWAWRTGRKIVRAVVWLSNNLQENANHLRLVAEREGVPHERLDVMTDALEDSRYPRRGQVPPERQRRKHGTLALEDRQGVEAVRAIRALIKEGKGVPE